MMVVTWRLVSITLPWSTRLLDASANSYIKKTWVYIRPHSINIGTPRCDSGCPYWRNVLLQDLVILEKVLGYSNLWKDIGDICSWRVGSVFEEPMDSGTRRY